MRSSIERQNDLEAVRKLLFAIAQIIVDESDSIRISYRTDSNVTTYTISVSVADTPKLIGKHGRTAKALRTILSGIGTKQNFRLSLEILDANREPQVRDSPCDEDAHTIYIATQ